MRTFRRRRRFDKKIRRYINLIEEKVKNIGEISANM